VIGTIKQVVHHDSQLKEIVSTLSLAEDIKDTLEDYYEAQFAPQVEQEKNELAAMDP
jgi:hypothetical protein